MHKDFADWYRKVHIEPKADDLEKRWLAIEAFHQEVTADDMCDAARVFFGLTPKDGDFLERYRQEFKDVDSAFAMHENQAELQVLAGATLANHFGAGDGWATAAALSLVCGACEGGRKSLVPEIVDLARRSLREYSASLRSARKKSVVAALDVNDKVQNLKTVLSNGGGNFQSLQGPLMDVIQPLTKAVNAIAAWARHAGTVENLRQEESDILWWLFGERSRDLEVPFAEMKAPSGCLVGAKEVADLTRVLPGPFGVEAYLHKMLALAHPDLDGTVSLSDAVMASPLEWLGRFGAHKGADSVVDLCPVHLAAQKCVEGGGRKTMWPGPFQTVSGLKATIKLKPLDLAMQAYRERLFVDALDRLQELADE